MSPWILGASPWCCWTLWGVCFAVQLDAFCARSFFGDWQEDGRTQLERQSCLICRFLDCQSILLGSKICNALTNPGLSSLDIFRDTTEILVMWLTGLIEIGWLSYLNAWMNDSLSKSFLQSLFADWTGDPAKWSIRLLFQCHGATSTWKSKAWNWRCCKGCVTRWKLQRPWTADGFSIYLTLSVDLGITVR